MSIRYYKPLIKKIVKQKESLKQENIKDFIIYLANNEYKIEIVNENKEKKKLRKMTKNISTLSLLLKGLRRWLNMYQKKI